jgi:hypothetical protein
VTAAHKPSPFPSLAATLAWCLLSLTGVVRNGRYWEGNIGLTVANVTSTPFRTLPDGNDDTGFGYGSPAGVMQLLADGAISQMFPGGGWTNQLLWDGVLLVADSSRQPLRPWEEASNVRHLTFPSA